VPPRCIQHRDGTNQDERVTFAMAEHILRAVLSLSQLSTDQAWALFVFIASEIALVYFVRQVWLRCD
jgi:hypothetical protein